MGLLKGPRSILACLAVSGLWAMSVAQDVCYPQATSAAITVCVPNSGKPKPTPSCVDGPKPWIKNPEYGTGVITVAVPMPSCVSCGCPSCVWADVYTTSFVAFCPTGTTTRVYEVQEYYTGLSAAPSVTKRPSVPYGFTSEVQTCTVCGPKPVTASVTYAATNYPFATGLSGPSPAPNGVPGWVVKPEGDKLGWTPAGYVSPLSGKFEAGWVPYPGPGSADAKAPGMPGAPNGPYVASPPPGAAGSKPLPGGGSVAGASPNAGQPLPQTPGSNGGVSPAAGQPLPQTPGSNGGVSPAAGQPLPQTPGSNGGVSPAAGQPLPQTPGSNGGVSPAAGQPLPQTPGSNGGVSPAAGQPLPQTPGSNGGVSPAAGQPLPQTPGSNAQGSPQKVSSASVPTVLHGVAHVSSVLSLLVLLVL